MRDRLISLHAASVSPLVVTVGGGIRLLVSLESFGRDWIAAEVVEGAVPRGRCVIPLAAIATVTLAPDRVAASLGPAGGPGVESSLALRLGLPFVLRDLCRRRRAVDLLIEHTTVHGTVDRVGRDHLDLALHEPDSPRRASHVTQVQIVPLASLVLISF